MKVLFIIIFLATVLKTHAQCKRVLGSVQDQASGERLPGATVQLLGKPGVGTSTDPDGKFELNIESADSLLITFIGYIGQRLAIPTTCEVTVFLMPVAGALDEVVIQAERLIAEEFTINTISKLEIYTNPSAKADPLLAVNSSTSSTTLDESANISLRGSSPAETGIFLNNVPINDAIRYAQLNGIGTFSIFNTALIKQVQVYPGNPPIEFGNTTSGLVALSTDDVIPKKNTNTISASLASFGFYTQRKITANSSLTAFSNVQPSAILRWFNPSALTRIKKFNTIDLGIHYLARLSERTMLKIFNYSNVESFLYDAISPSYRGDFNQDKLRNYTVTNLRHRWRNAEISLNNGISFSKSKFSYSSLNVDLHQRDFFMSANYCYYGTKSELKAGLSYDYRGSSFAGTYPRYDFAISSEFPTDTASFAQSANLPEVYFYGKHYIAPKLIAGVGFRKSLPFQDQSQFLSGQININYKPSTPWNIILSAGRYNKIQISREGEIIPFLIGTHQYSLDVSYTHARLESSISLFSKHGKQNSTTTEITGMEVYGRYRFTPQLRGQLSLTSLKALETTAGISKSSPYNIHYFLRGNLEYKFAGTWTTTIAFLFRQGSFYIPVDGSFYNTMVGAYEPVYGNQKRLPNYSLIDVSVSKLFMVGREGSAVAFAGLGNVPNIQNVRGYTYNSDYSQKQEELFSLRIIYFGVVINF
jgi:hypothetical protein